MLACAREVCQSHLPLAARKVDFPRPVSMVGVLNLLSFVSAVMISATSVPSTPPLHYVYLDFGVVNKCRARKWGTHVHDLEAGRLGFNVSRLVSGRIERDLAVLCDIHCDDDAIGSKAREPSHLSRRSRRSSNLSMITR